MKKIIVFTATFVYLFCFSQMKINKSKEVDILINTPWKFGDDNIVDFVIKNNSNNTYIIDPYGFVGKSCWQYEGKKLDHIDFQRGYYTRLNDEDCKDDLILLKPKAKINVNLNLDYYQTKIFDLSKSGKYFLNVKSKHDRESSMPSSCKSYINTLEMKGYIMLEDSIVAKIPFVR